MFGAKAAMPAYERLVIIFIPENGSEYASLDACAATCAPFLLEEHAAAFTQDKRVFRAGAGARRVFAGAADGQEKAMLHTPGRLYAYAAFCEARVPVNARAGEHAALAAHAFVGVYDLKSHKTILS